MMYFHHPDPIAMQSMHPMFLPQQPSEPVFLSSLPPMMLSPFPVPSMPSMVPPGVMGAYPPMGAQPQQFHQQFHPQFLHPAVPVTAAPFENQFVGLAPVRHAQPQPIPERPLQSTQRQVPFKAPQQPKQDGIRPSNPAGAAPSSVVKSLGANTTMPRQAQPIGITPQADTNLAGQTMHGSQQQAGTILADQTMGPQQQARPNLIGHQSPHQTATNAATQQQSSAVQQQPEPLQASPAPNGALSVPDTMMEEREQEQQAIRPIAGAFFTQSLDLTPFPSFASQPTSALTSQAVSSISSQTMSSVSSPALTPTPSPPLEPQAPPPRSAPPPPLAPPPKVTVIPNCRTELVIEQKPLPYHRFLPMTWLDNYYHQQETKTYQTLGFRFTAALDPRKAAVSLAHAVEVCPVVGSKVVAHNGQNKFQFDAERLVLHLIHVSPPLLTSLPLLEALVRLLVPPRSGDDKELFRAFLLRSSSDDAGSALLCEFQHTLGDAASYATFMREWAVCYENFSRASPPAPPLELPPQPFVDTSALDLEFKRSPDMVQRHFVFSDVGLRRLKDTVLRESTGVEAVSTNDILCAQIAIATAPFRYKQWGETNLHDDVKVFLLIDTRGRSSQDGAWGNNTKHIDVEFAWHELFDVSSSNVLRVARKIRARLTQQLALLASDYTAFSQEQLDRRERKSKKLFTLNSWAKVGDVLRQAQFKDPSKPIPPPPKSTRPPAPSSTPSFEGVVSAELGFFHTAQEKGGPPAIPEQNLQEMRWFNACWHPRPETIVIEALVSGGGGKIFGEGDKLILHIASPLSDAEEELSAMARFWPMARLRTDL